MTVDSHIKRGHPITFGLLVLFGAIELALSAWLTARFNKRHDYSGITERDRVRFCLVASIWTVVFSIFYLVLFTYASRGGMLTSILSHIVYLSLTWVIWTAAAASVTELLGGGLNCNNQDEFSYCGQLNALEAFAWIEWLLVTFGLVIVLVKGISAARRGDGYKGGLIA
ncbi:hypothetical protein DL96DRAFT_1714864 [Flagelloscypha sp. PMI_526]|nr:hypothetical protein DL96DRAFT_1714864 [Flagelloscypha sp. PMI_526]